MGNSSTCGLVGVYVNWNHLRKMKSAGALGGERWY
jgi:hypothetical protein